MIGRSKAAKVVLKGVGTLYILPKSSTDVRCHYDMLEKKEGAPKDGVGGSDNDSGTNEASDAHAGGGLEASKGGGQASPHMARASSFLSTGRSNVGFPREKPSCKGNPHGWFYPPHRVVLSHVLTSGCKEIIELGSWLGKSTRFLHSQSPSDCVVYAVDIWDNSFSLSDDHYFDSNSEETGTGKNRSNQVQTNQDILKNQDLYDTFLSTNWEHRFVPHSGKGGMLPVRTTTLEGLELLKSVGVDPSVIYIDADHHYEPAKKDMEKSLLLFPKAVIVGDDWDYEPVRRAAQELSAKYGRSLYVEQGKCWAFLEATHKELEPSRKIWTDSVANTAEHSRIYARIASFIKNGDDNVGGVKEVINGNTKPVPRDLAGVGPEFKGRSLLMLCAIHGSNKIQSYIAEYFDINYKTKSKMETALHLACYYGRIEQCKDLVRRGADLDVKNEYGETAIECASQSRYPASKECASFLSSVTIMKRRKLQASGTSNNKRTREEDERFREKESKAQKR